MAIYMRRARVWVLFPFGIIVCAGLSRTYGVSRDELKSGKVVELTHEITLKCGDSQNTDMGVMCVCVMCVCVCVCVYV